MDDAGALGVLGGTDGANQSGGDAGAQVDAHDDGIDQLEGHHAGGGKGLEDTHHGRGALDDDGEHKAGEDAQNRHVAEVGQNVDESLRFGQRLHGVGHADQAHEQNAKAHADVADVLGAALFDEHGQNHADDQCQRGQGIRLEERQDGTAGGVDVHQSDDLGRDGGADVGAQNDAHRLLEVQNARADEANGENNGGGGALDDGGDDGTGEKTQENILGQLTQEVFQGGAGALLEAVAHDLHTVEEHGKAAQKFDQCENGCH